jgi:anti-anti-sigma factor
MDDICVTSPGHGVAVVELKGEHDFATRTEMTTLLGQAVANNDLVVVDVSDALFIDSSFLHNLVKAHRAADARGSSFVLQMGTAHIVRRALEISGLLERLDVAHTRAEALSRRRPSGTPAIGGADRAA